MSKSFLFIDTPTNCVECILRAYIAQIGNVCVASNMRVIPYDLHNYHKPNHCPLIDTDSEEVKVEYDRNKTIYTIEVDNE